MEAWADIRTLVQTASTPSSLGSSTAGQRTSAANDTEAYAGTELEQAQRDGKTLLGLMVENALRGRYGSSELNDPEQLQSIGGPKHSSMTPEGKTAAMQTAADPTSKSRLPDIDPGIAETRCEVDLVTRDSSTLKNLDSQLMNNRELLRHV